uniref:non-specific serine/threonine protein kinase n=1 Tax=Oryzias latipes TaxID=8090 RepID=A0A3P9L161_ORYLA
MFQLLGRILRKIFFLEAEPPTSPFSSDLEKDSVESQDGAKVKQKGTKRRISEDSQESITPAKKKRELEFPSQKDESARSKPVGSRKRKASDTEQLPTKRMKESTDEEEDPKLEFEAKYVELNPLGEGGCGSVFNGYRKSDKLVVAIKHIPNENIYCTHFDESGRELSVEVAVMLKLQSGTSNSAGSKAPITLLDWYVLPHELILVLERPMPASDLQSYIERRGGSLKESEAKIILKQLIEAAIHLQDEKIFHRDIKLENILIEMCSGTPRVRIIDFGLSCFTEKNSNHNTFYGTECHIPPEWLFWYQYSAGPTTVWQLGIVLFECLHKKPFNSSSFIRRTIKINNRLSKDCKDFLKQCFTRDPKERPKKLKIRILHKIGLFYIKNGKLGCFGSITRSPTYHHVKGSIKST